MTWMFVTLVCVMGFMLVKVRRRRKMRQADGADSYSRSKAA